MMFQRLRKQREEVLAAKSQSTRTHTSSSSNKQQRKKLSRSSKTKTNVSRCSSSSSSSSSIKAFDFLQNDSNYVLRLCQKGNNTNSRSLSTKWSSIERCCKWISEAAAEDSCFVADSAKLQLQFRQTDEWGNTPLHIICYNKPPPYIIEAYLNAVRSCCTSLESTLLTTTNDKGATPLLVSCKSGSCRNAIKSLLQGDDGSKAITMCDNDGTTVFDALHNRYKLVKRIPALREHWTDIDTIEKEELSLMNKNSEANNINGDDDKIELGPVELLSSFDKDKTTTTTTTTTEEPTNKTSAAVPSSHYLFPLFWRINEDLILSAWNTEVSSPSGDETKTTDYVSDLHRAALIADCLPETIIDMILRICGNDNDDDDDDKDYHDNVKMSPLYLAFVRRIGFNHPKLQRQHAYFCKRLIEKDPSVFKAAASSKVCSRSLFCQAIASGYHWNLLNEIEENGVTTAEGDEEEEEDRLQGPVQLLFKQDPNAIAEADKATGLLPFMLAAAAAPTISNTTMTPPTTTTTKEEHNTQEQEHESNLQLDTIYNLLRASPESIQR